MDIHNHHIHAELDKEIQYRMEEAGYLKRCFDDFLETLEGAETFEYNAGFDAKCGQYSLMALVKEAGSQRTLIFGVDTNGVTDDLNEIRGQFEDEFDEVVLFSMDTHVSVYDPANMDDFDGGLVEKVVETVAETVSSASIGVTNNRTDRMQLLKPDYSGLFSV